MLPPSPPAQIVESPGRAIALPGYGGATLKASLLSADNHPYFAVMVADFGPTDRDWFNPLLRDPKDGTPLASHGGRDFAMWLQGLGIGSLRYDKRYVGSRDPRLDISLEAQLGDLRAILMAVRRMPEAQGRKILLVGHGEGALLSLLIAQEADALLLLGMPGQSLAATISGQLRSRLPEANAKPSLAYLEAVFQAIRSKGSAPIPAGDVHPSVTSLADTLMAPESLSFVKNTLDLDPWRYAARLLVPCAMVWGDRDTQTPRPGMIPSSYRGRVINLPGANHLLKRETRSAASLVGSEALDTYGDTTPLADLSPLAQWLKEL
jgi:hypothetical protein